MTTKIKFPALHMGQVVDASENRRVPDEPEMFTEEQAREMLRAACKKAGNPSAWATQHGLSRQYVFQMLDGSDPIGWKVARAIGLRRVYRFVLDKGPADA